MKLSQKIWFTLIELMTTVAIVLVLATIWYISYTDYLKWVRDTSRSSQIASIYDGLQLFAAKWRIPLPDNYIEVRANSVPPSPLWLQWYQWFAGASILDFINFDWGGKDPRDKQYFTLYMTKDRRYFQLLAFLENKETLLSHVVDSANALVDFSWKTATVYGSRLWVLTTADNPVAPDTSSLNTPIQLVPWIIASTYVDIALTTTNYNAYFWNAPTDKITANWSNGLRKMIFNKSCKRILEIGASKWDGIYKINPNGEVNWEISAYCDMTSDGGGWTLVLKNDGDSDNGNLSNSRNTGFWYNIDYLQTNDFDYSAAFNDTLTNALVTQQYRMETSTNEKVYGKLSAAYVATSTIVKNTGCTYSDTATYATVPASWRIWFSGYTSWSFWMMVDAYPVNTNLWWWNSPWVYCSGTWTAWYGKKTRVFVK